MLPVLQAWIQEHFVILWVPCTQDWSVAVGSCLAEAAEGFKPKLLLRCGVPPFLCWPFEQHNCLIADHFVSSPLQFPSFILSVLPIFQGSRGLLCCLQCGPHVLCRICSAEQRQLWINTAPHQCSGLQALVYSALFAL